MKIMVKFELKAQRDKLEEINTFFKNILPDTRTYEGCEGVFLSSSEEDKNEFVLIEYWQSEIHFDKYLNWRKETGDFDTLGSLLSESLDIKTFTQIEAA